MGSGEFRLTQRISSKGDYCASETSVSAVSFLSLKPISKLQSELKFIGDLSDLYMVTQIRTVPVTCDSDEDRAQLVVLSLELMMQGQTRTSPIYCAVPDWLFCAIKE